MAPISASARNSARVGEPEAEDALTGAVPLHVRDSGRSTRPALMDVGTGRPTGVTGAERRCSPAANCSGTGLRAVARTTVGRTARSSGIVVRLGPAADGLTSRVPRAALMGSVRIGTVCRDAAFCRCTLPAGRATGTRGAASVTPDSNVTDIDPVASSAPAATGAGCSDGGGASGAAVASAASGCVGSGVDATAGEATAAGACGGGAGAVLGAFGAGGFAGVDDGSLDGSATRGGRKDSGSRYPFGSEVVRTPMCTEGSACSGVPDGPIAPTAAPSATCASRATATDPRWTRVTE